MSGKDGNKNSGSHPCSHCQTLTMDQACCYIVEFYCQLANKESEHQGDCARKGSRTQSQSMMGEGLRLFNAKAIPQLPDPEQSLTIQVAPDITICQGVGICKNFVSKDMNSGQAVYCAGTPPLLHFHLLSSPSDPIPLYSVSILASPAFKVSSINPQPF